ncbi:hypothetical protein [Streptomyces sp. CC219B]|uniref:hypothetical protein n=1 Tax=Streptomyces sp. CC219B TaxID=3044574 RepID=UPI0024A907AC|nr:hypothetical protein [Streptomyces sp. CC219B]
MSNPYRQPSRPQQPPRPADARPLRRRKRVWIGGVALFALGAIGGTQSAQDEANASRTVAATPTATITMTATATPKPAPAVTVTKTAKPKPAPTVTVTKTAQAAAGSSTSSGSSDSTGTCSIRSNSGNCYQAGQFCRNSDHGATTTTASGARITCTYSSNAWRWTYS